MNKICICGRLTKEPTSATTQKGMRYCNVVVAVQRPNTKGQVDFFSCVAWQEKADFITKYMHKGDLIGITGMLQSRSYQDKNGQTKNITEIFIELVDFLQKSNNQNTNTNNNRQQQEAFGTETPNYEPPF